VGGASVGAGAGWEVVLLVGCVPGVLAPELAGAGVEAAAEAVGLAAEGTGDALAPGTGARFEDCVELEAAAT